METAIENSKHTCTTMSSDVISIFFLFLNNNLTNIKQLNQERLLDLKKKEEKNNMFCVALKVHSQNIDSQT